MVWRSGPTRGCGAPSPREAQVRILSPCRFLFRFFLGAPSRFGCASRPKPTTGPDEDVEINGHKFSDGSQAWVNTEVPRFTDPVEIKAIQRFTKMIMSSSSAWINSDNLRPADILNMAKCVVPVSHHKAMTTPWVGVFEDISDDEADDEAEK